MEDVERLLATSSYAGATDLLRYAEIMSQLSSDELEEAFARFHNSAARYDYWCDCDVGALLLERVADGMCVDSTRQRVLYRHAHFRAVWCAQAATSGGEGIARSVHIKRLEAKLSTVGECSPVV